MARIVEICALVFVIYAGLHQGVTAGRPRIIPKRDELFIDEGEELRIECEGEGKLHFSTQKLIGNAQQSNFTVRYDEYSHTYKFIRPHTTRQDTGWYACAEEDIEIKNTEQTIEHPSEDISWIYVYVKSSESFAVKDQEASYETLPMLAGSDGVIPCRPTSPDLPVVLEINYVVTPTSESVLYDPKIGFILKNVSLDRNGDNYECKINGTDESGGSYFPAIQGNKVLQNLAIDQDRLHHPVWGQDLTLECRITVAESTGFELNWKAPNSVPPRRLRYSKMQRLTKKGSKETWKIELTIENAEESDGGEYDCVASSLHEENHKTTEIRFFDPDAPYVELKMDRDKSSVTLPKGEVAKWKINIDTYPTNFTYQWLKSDGTEIKSTKVGSKGKYSHSHTGSRDHIFRISQLGIEDSDNYTIRVKALDKEESIILPLLVEGRPETSIYKSLSSYERGKYAIFSCNTKGSPLPNITWSYRAYTYGQSTKESEDIPLPNIRSEIKEEKPFHLVSHLNITINRTGDLVCRTCNKFDCSEDIVSITVTDPPGEFSLVGPDSVAEGDDNARLICSASRINFTDEIEWQFTNSDGLPERIPEKVNISKYSTNLTSVSILQIPNVSLSDGGVYSCEVECIETGKKTANHTLEVLKPYEPILTRTSLNNSRIVIKRRKNQSMNLTCEADGVPTPKVTWYKDDKLLVASNQYEFSDNNFTFIIRFFDVTDCGRYLCRAENRIGKAEHFLDIEIEGTQNSESNIIWIVLICILIVIIIIVITYMGIKVRREKRLRKELLEAGLTNFEDGAVECLNPELTVDEQAELLPYDKKWEFPRELLKLGKQLGSGAFGVVMKAEARGICVEGETTTVAVKMVRRSADPSYMKALSSELKIMIHLGRHLNVVNLLGACTKTILTKRELYVIVEYCRFGNLHNYLQRHRDHFIDQISPSTQKIDPSIGSEHLEGRQSVGSQNRSKFTSYSFSPSISINSSDSSNDIQLVDYRQGPDSGDINMSPDGGILSNNSSQPGWRSNYRGDYKDQNLKPICTQDLLCWAWQVARGMEYLSARNVLHGDLAARNILLADDNIVKICDFGLAKNMYKDNNYKKKGDGPLPIKWMAVESIRDRIFSTQSDVWSFGIVLWEFFTLARTPYPGMEAEKLYDKLIGGYRMEKPEYATDEIYNFIVNCWQAKPSARPLFSELVERIGNLLDERVKTHHFDLNTPYMNMNNAALQNGHSDYLTMISAPNHGYYNSPKPVAAEMHSDSAYVSMNRLKQSSQSAGISIQSPRVEETHFEFPPNRNVSRDTEHCGDSSPMPTTQNASSKPVNVQQVRNDFIRNSRERNINGGDSDYCNITNNPHYANLGKRSSAIVNNSNQNTKGTRSEMNNAKALSPSAISDQESRNNKTNLLKDRAGGSFSNPSYVLMSKNKLKEEE